MKDAFRDYIIHEILQLKPVFRCVWLFILYTAIFSSISGILMLIRTPLTELKRIYLPLGEKQYTKAQIQRKHVVSTVVVIIVVVAVFIVCERCYAAQANNANALRLRELLQYLEVQLGAWIVVSA